MYGDIDLAESLNSIGVNHCVGSIFIAQLDDFRDRKPIAKLVLHRHYRYQCRWFLEEARACFQVKIAMYGFNVRSAAIPLSLKTAHRSRYRRMLQGRSYDSACADSANHNRTANGKVVRLGSARCEKNLIGLSAQSSCDNSTTVFQHALCLLAQRMYGRCVAVILKLPHHNLHHLRARFGCGSIVQVGFAIGALLLLVYGAVLRFTAHRVPAFRAGSTSANASGGVCVHVPSPRFTTSMASPAETTPPRSTTPKMPSRGKMQSPAKW